MSFDVLDLRGLDGTAHFISKNGVLWKFIHVIVVNLVGYPMRFWCLVDFGIGVVFRFFIGKFFITGTKTIMLAFALGNLYSLLSDLIC